MSRSLGFFSGLMLSGLMLGCGGTPPPPPDNEQTASTEQTTGGTPAVAPVITPTPAPTPPPAPAEGPWAQWRGAHGLGLTAETNLPTVWAPNSANIKWKSVVPGNGNSSPVVSNGRVYLTSERPDNHQRLVLAYDLQTGAKLWETALTYAVPSNAHFMSTRAVATPVADGEAVYVFFGGVLAKLSAEGAILWQHQDIDPNYQANSQYGASSSPVLYKDTVIVLHDRENGETEAPGILAAFDRSTGEERWRQEWMHTCCTYASPLLHEFNGKTMVIIAHSAEVAGFDADTGARLWKHRHETMIQICTSPVALGDLLIVAGGIPDKHAIAYKLTDGPEPEVLWSTHQSIPDLPSPVIHDGLVFFLTKDSVMTCHDARTGEVKWRERLPAGDYFASLVVGDGKIYAVNNYGITAVVAASGTFQLLAENRLFDYDTTIGTSNASPAVADGLLLVRSHSMLFGIEREAS